uniref:Uncharacterized protein n=1 Tax=Arundo donax TaxID=35708 RepID=A0A0A9BVL4_ARUDO
METSFVRVPNFQSRCGCNSSFGWE